MMSKQMAHPQKTQAEALHQQAIQALTSGKLAAGIKLLEKALALNPQFAAALQDLGTAYWQTGRPALAEKAYAQAFQAAPKNPLVLNAYGAFLLEQYRLEDADPILSQAFALKPDHFEIANNLGLLRFRQYRLKEAESLFARSIKFNPRWPNAYANLGNVLCKTMRPELAEKALRQALQLNPNHALAMGLLGEVYAAQGRDEEGLAYIRKSLSVAPNEPMLWIRLLELLEKKTLLDEVEETLKQVKALGLFAPGFVLAELKLLRRRGKFAEATALVETHIDRLKTAPARPSIFAFFFEAGQLYDRQNEIDKAFECFSIANRMQKEIEGVPADVAATRTGTLRPLTEFTTAQAEQSCALPADQRPAPVFLVGFPRSGTTLLDQILSSHPAIEVAEEKGAIDKCLVRFVEICGADHREEMLEAARKEGRQPSYLDNPAYPSALAELSTGDIAEIRDIFYREHAWPPQDSAKQILIDKLPLNMLYAGFIRRIFPDAKFILALRHPCDSVLSCFMQHFQINSYMARFLDLKDAAQFYDEAFRLWDHYNTVQDMGAHAIHYEDVVANFRPTVAKLLEFLGIDWDDAVLKYDETAKKRKIINTPSYSQVTEKLYTRASGRWLRYRKHMEPVLDILAPHAIRHGYSMEPQDDEK